MFTNFQNLRHCQTGVEVNLVDLSKSLRIELSRLLLNTDPNEASDGELAAMISFAIAFPQGFMALVDTYDVLRYLLAPLPSCVCMPASPTWIRHLAAEIGSRACLAITGFSIFIYILFLKVKAEASFLEIEGLFILKRCQIVAKHWLFKFNTYYQFCFHFLLS